MNRRTFLKTGVTGAAAIATVRPKLFAADEDKPLRVALIGSGVSLITKIKISLVSLLMGIMIFIWLLVLHIPRAIAMPDLDNGNELTSVFQALAFSGVGAIFSYIHKPRTT